MSDFTSAAQIGLPQLANPATAGTGLSTAVSAGRSRLSETSTFSRLGLSMLFSVKIAGCEDLGKWSSCEGLKVEFKYEKLRSGGEYDCEYIQPQHVTYSPVTLRRGVEFTGSGSVQAWLRGVVLRWQLWEGQGRQFSGTTVTIDLFDVYKTPVAGWRLKNAYPVSWSGPSMNAKTNEVALETLVFEHEGFLTEPLT
jgi:phage tail-like protein